ncbi:MAG: hypothetical protein RL266_2445 [Bacteroidota bacterium]|jgi:tetratricopeptide (TPR) repeat protein
MKHFVISLFLFACTAVSAQVFEPQFDQVAKKFEKGSYESALETAEALMENDKYKKEPEPYLWAAMCFYQIHLSDDEKLKERFKSALRDALKYAGKAVAKDKNGTLMENNKDFFDTMKEEGIKAANEFELENNYRKASYTYKQILAFAPEDAFVQFAKGVTDIRLSSMVEAEKEIGEAFPVIERNYRDLSYEPDPVSSPLLKPNVIYYIDHLLAGNYADSAKTVLMAARVFFPLDEEIKQKLQELE